MKKTFFAVAIVATMGLALASCQNDTLDDMMPGLPNATENAAAMRAASATAYTVNNVQGDYAGRLDKVVMNGKDKNPVESQTITISANGADKFDIYLPPFQVGNMPGSIEIDAQGITLNADGSFTASNLESAVILKLLGVRHYYKATLVTGKFTRRASGGYDLEFGIDSEGHFGIIQIFKAHVHFTGGK